MKLSILIPAYNTAPFIEKTLLSLTQQTRQDFEIILVDDGSTDGTEDVAYKLMQKQRFASFKLIRQQNCGVSAARNHALSRAKGEYVLFLDSDDYLAQNTVEQLYTILEEKRATSDAGSLPDCICWAFATVTESGELIKSHCARQPTAQSRISGVQALHRIVNEQSLYVCTGSIAFRRDVLQRNNLQYYEGCVNGEDQEFFFKALAHSDSFISINSVHTFYVRRSGSITNQFDIRLFDAIQAMQRVYNYFMKADNPQLHAIAATIAEKEVLQNYYFNIRLCYTYGEIGLPVLLDMIDKNYPNLNEQMRSLMLGYNGSHLKLRLKNWLFLHARFLFVIWLRLAH